MDRALLSPDPNQIQFEQVPGGRIGEKFSDFGFYKKLLGKSLKSKTNRGPIHVVTFTLISNLATDYIQKRGGEPGLFSFEYNLSPNLISK